ncbi:MAG TPA: hypothetical protein DHV03_08020 [Alphaproteobacteria bacterium]|nr:hypothetical protein [Paracoccaceae bacterium]RCL81214.1 MAG: AAA family ATPase [SAR116 cluster bacterium]RPH14330.1 MAG: DNA polymerase III subunit delta' [Alphaproteobacteria bacterium TMED150]HBQ22643.1 hypothetical protein [Alphaproteobacteria bacterium]HCY48617.1 hypothetical protein [Alphaproteobacteria bacterium]|tara:strand:+ start:5389 stop:6360 length:972 start_codon:yes stop_codon:yes gene_type:complete
MLTPPIGHADIRQELHGQWLAGRLHHAFLLTGPRGCGKATLARYFCGQLLTYGTKAPEDPNAPISARVETQMHAGSHPDMVEVGLTRIREEDEDARVIKIEHVRTHVARLFGHKGERNAMRACLIDPVEKMNISASNALLKMLEEPPENTIFFLISQQYGAVLPTIRSRCRRLQLQGLQPEEARQVVGTFMQEDEEVHPLLAQLQPGDAGRMTGQGGSLALKLIGDVYAGREDPMDMSADATKYLKSLQEDKSLERVAVFFEVLILFLHHHMREAVAVSQHELAGRLANMLEGLAKRQRDMSALNFDRRRVATLVLQEIRHDL